MTRALAAALVLALGCGGDTGESPHKVYVALGFHGNFYHSWRGDTPDEAGFGTDIRVVREILRILDEANAEGLDARGYWDVENLFTYERILPEHAPDILEGIRRRVAAGRDEILLMPYDNGLIHAMTPEELRANVRWAISNPWGSGVRDLFGNFTPILRPQEMMLTPGVMGILQQEGIEGLALLYSSVPFNAISSFLKPLPPEQRYGVTRFRMRANGPRMLLLPTSSVGDVVDHISLEKWLLDLRALQTDGQVGGDLLLHINADADGDFWLPQNLPAVLMWLPNAGGLREYIEAVNRYDWAEFTTPARYLKDHPPVGDVMVHQDLADGGFDGQYSWAEKFASHSIWTRLEQSRLASWRAQTLASGAPDSVRREAFELLWNERDSSFWERVVGLSTTHFGMSTPIVNEERQAVAESVTGRARELAWRAERLLADAAVASGPRPDREALYVFDVRDVRPLAPGVVTRTLLRIPLIFAGAVPATRLEDEAGAPFPHAIVSRLDLGDGRVAGTLWALLPLAPAEMHTLRLMPDAAPPANAPASPGRLANGHVQVTLDPESGISSLQAGDWVAGGPDFLSAFISYRSDDVPVQWDNGAWEIRAPETGSDWLDRVHLRTRVPFETPDDAEVAAEIEVTLSLPANAPWLVADVEVAYPYTRKRDVLHTAAQKLRRLLDQRWIEVAPFQLKPLLQGTREKPLRVWKHNYLDVTSFYDLDYAQINPNNAEIDAFNHQITAGWVAVSDRQNGLLVAADADVRASFAFAPMRLREFEGRQMLWLNPFGSYYGRQLDYSHLDGDGIGADITELFSSSLRPNGPSYNGEHERFSLLLAPYAGDAPPEWLREDARAFFASPAVVYRKAPEAAGAGVRLPRDIEIAVEAARTRLARQRSGPLPGLRAFLVSPSGGAADVVWDEPDDLRIDGYHVEWKRLGTSAWQRATLSPTRRHRITGLADGDDFMVRARAFGENAEAAWTAPELVRIGAVPVVDMSDEAIAMPPRLMLRYLRAALDHVWSTW